VTLSYRRVGEGADVVLIHGLAANHAFWNLPVLLPLIREHAVTVYDLRGHGGSSMPPAGYTVAHMAEDLAALLDHLGIARAHLVGHSYGGVVALRYAASHPGRVASLTIADARVRALQPHQRLRDWPDWRSAQKRLQELGLVVGEDEPEVGLRLLEALADPEWRARHRQNGGGRSLFVPFGKWGDSSARRWLELLERTSIKREIMGDLALTLEELEGIAAPTLAIYGERSRTLQSCFGLQTRLPRCKTVIVPEVGHFYPLIRPRFFVECVLQFLAGVEAEEPC
jgi:pimeloyl-ACP methyl ester carboxylesterase